MESENTPKYLPFYENVKSVKLPAQHVSVKNDMHGSRQVSLPNWTPASQERRRWACVHVGVWIHRAPYARLWLFNLAQVRSGSRQIDLTVLSQSTHGNTTDRRTEADATTILPRERLLSWQGHKPYMAFLPWAFCGIVRQDLKSLFSAEHHQRQSYLGAPGLWKRAVETHRPPEMWLYSKCFFKNAQVWRVCSLWFYCVIKTNALSRPANSNAICKPSGEA